ncbi:MAG: hypothetical protein OJF50_003395 [Nitrospira sp.]|nr:hypothetical protein [Nitrospira sp.]
MRLLSRITMLKVTIGIDMHDNIPMTWIRSDRGVETRKR